MSAPGLGPLAGLLPGLLSGLPLAVLTGAGISAESGLPTFRGPGGMWEGNRPEDLATSEAFESDPGKVWRFYAWRLEKLRLARPNAGHDALARMERVLPRMTLVTQNVDGLHAAAGSRNVLELHGTLLRARCTVCEKCEPAPGAALLPLPRCACGGLLRPDVVWFGEPLLPATWEAAARAAGNCAVFLVVGTSSVVAPASSLAAIAAESGAKVFEINPEETPLTPLAAGVFRGSAASVLPRIANALEGKQGAA